MCFYCYFGICIFVYVCLFVYLPVRLSVCLSLALFSVQEVKVTVRIKQLFPNEFLFF